MPNSAPINSSDRHRSFCSSMTASGGATALRTKEWNHPLPYIYTSSPYLCKWAKTI
ncbi:hypothetical protein M378DRAFT_174064, partial [Amanita muscaria Koide BX008]